MTYLRLLLLPLCPLWALISQIRTELYMANIIKRYTPPVPTFVIGNLSTGGTGKSPHTAYIAQILSNTYRTTILSRGYGRKTKGFLLACPTSTASQIGDEPLMLSHELPEVKIAVSENRAKGIEQLLSQYEKPEVIVMDDAYQHLRVKAQCYFLLTRYDRPFFSDYLLPAGDLRELRLNAARTHCVIVTKTPSEVLQDSEKRELYKKYISHYTKAPVIFSTYAYSPYIKNAADTKIPVPTLKDYSVLLITGIAQPKPLLEHLQANNITYTHRSYPDHHTFTDDDIRKIKNDFLNLPTKKRIILTTEKDMMRLLDTEVSHLPLYSISVTVKMDEESEKTVRKILNKYANNN